MVPQTEEEHKVVLVVFLVAVTTPHHQVVVAGDQGPLVLEAVEDLVVEVALFVPMDREYQQGLQVMEVVVAPVAETLEDLG